MKDGRRKRAVARIRSDEGGFTLIEVTVAAMLLVVAVVGTFGIIDTSSRATYRAEETQSVINIAQREMELLRQVPYQRLAMTAVPAPPYGTDANDPTSRMRSGNTFCLERVDGNDPCTAPPLVANGGSLEVGGAVSGGQVQPVSQDVKVGDITVDVYRFVVWQDEGDELLPATDPVCVHQPLQFLCKTQDYKRAIVIVRVNEAPISFARSYQEVQSNFIDPDRATLDAQPLGPSGSIVTGQQFWLSDARCSNAATEPTRPSPSDHQTHDTTGSGLTGCSTNPADALLTSPPPGGDAPGGSPFYDLSTELESGGCGTVGCNPDDKGLQMLDQGGSCSPSPAGPDAPKQIHRWVTRPIGTGGQFVVTDRATLELFTRTIDGVNGASGHVCAFLFKRTAAGVDVQLASDAYQDSTWPSNGWVGIPFRFNLDALSLAQRTLLSGERLGVAIGVDPSGTPDNVLQFLYDHPEGESGGGESRLEVLTTTPLQE
jgi:type II secretory pathway pseudopilin PulG